MLKVLTKLNTKIWYAGKELKYDESFPAVEEASEDADFMLACYKKAGITACCIHTGKYTHLYKEEK